MISNFELFESRSDIDAICKKYRIENYTINDDLSISVDGDVDLSSKDLIKIPIKFKEVSGHFHCYANNLESLEFCPQSVGGSFHCSNNKLESLEFGPQSVGGNFICSYNKLESLEFCPQSVGGNFYCSYNKLKSLEFCPQSVGGYFSCSDNKLESLEFCPQSVGGYFYCYDNYITNFDGLPEFFESYIDIYNNPVDEIYRLFNDPKCIYWIREFDVIQGNKVIKDRLEEVYVHMGLEMTKDIKFEEYILI